MKPRELVDIAELRRRYIALYTEVRRYIWPFDVVNDLVDIELECYQAFPDQEKLKYVFNKLRRYIESDIDLTEDKDLDSALRSFEELVNDNNLYYNNLRAVREVLSYEDLKEIQD